MRNTLINKSYKVVQMIISVVEVNYFFNMTSNSYFIQKATCIIRVDRTISIQHFPSSVVNNSSKISFHS